VDFAHMSSGRSPDDGRKATTSWRLCRHDHDGEATMTPEKSSNHAKGEAIMTSEIMPKAKPP
jgi:hypothetical protein